VTGAWVDRRQEAGADEGDGAFLDRIDALVMAEWDRRRRADRLQRLCDDYAVRTEFLSTLQDLITIREASGCIAQLPSRWELELLLNAIRQECLGDRYAEHGRGDGERAEDGWELPEDEELLGSGLDHTIPPGLAVGLAPRFLTPEGV
jgi:hypothetical protein